MIVQRPGNGTLLLITQPDHAALASRIIAAWDPHAFAPAALRSTVLFAIAEHDNGWHEIDDGPTLNPETRRPFDFMDAPQSFKLSIWPRGVERLAADSPQAAALVAQHGLTIHAHRRGDPAWRQFFAQLERLRDDLLSACGSASGAARHGFERNYDLLFLGDLLSLVFCNQWTEQTAARGYRAAFNNGQVLVAPDPFNRCEVPLEITARELPNRDYGSQGDLQAAWEQARALTLSGVARGVAKL